MNCSFPRLKLLNMRYVFLDRLWKVRNKKLVYFDCLYVIDYPDMLEPQQVIVCPRPALQYLEELPLEGVER